MLIRRFASLLLTSAVPLLAQISNNTVTVTASQNSMAAQPDEAVFAVTVGSGVNTSLDQIVSAVSGIGITAANLVAVSTPNPWFNTTVVAPTAAGAGSPSLQWTFQLVVSFSKLKDTTAALAALQKSISQNNSGLTLSFTLSGTRVSAQQGPACNLANLVSQARTQAQDIAGAAGFKPGAIVGLTSSTSNGAPLGCSLTARFALGSMFGQPGPNTITITATRTNAIQPDQVLMGLTVQSPTTAGLDDITGALTAAGISGANFTGVYTTVSYTSSGNAPPTQQSELIWSFTLTTPLAKLSATLTQLVAAQQTVSGNNSGLTLTFYVEGMQISPQLQQSQTCPQAALLADAQAQANQVATAAGVSAGAILSMAEGSSGIAALQLGSIQAVAGELVAGVGTSGVGYASLIAPTVYPAIQPTCALTAQFQLM